MSGLHPLFLSRRKMDESGFVVIIKLVNPHLEVEQYPFPRPDNLFATLTGGQKFTKLDLTHAYQQMLLEDEDRQNVNMHKGSYRYLRLPFSVASAPAIFQSQWIPYCKVYLMLFVILTTS